MSLQACDSTATRPRPEGRPGLSGTQLPIWPDDRRAIPNDLVRCALFTIGVSSERRYCRRERIAALPGADIIYTGMELRQRDEDVFLQLLHYQRCQQLGDRVRFSAHDLVTALGWTVNQRSYAELAECLERLKATSLEVITEDESGERAFAGSLIRSYAYRKGRGPNRQRWEIVFEPAILYLFANVAYSEIAWSQRLQLSPMAKWLHSFYHSVTARPLALPSEAIRGLCGSSMKNASRFRQMLRKALAELEERGFLASWEIDTHGLVHVRRSDGGAAR